MILIGRGLDLREEQSGGCGLRSEARAERKRRRMSEVSSQSEVSMVRERSGDSLCGFEGAEALTDCFGRSGLKGDSCSANSQQPKATAKSWRLRRTAEHISGDNSLRDPPVPIPNTEVKPQHADSTWLETAR